MIFKMLQVENKIEKIILSWKFKEKIFIKTKYYVTSIIDIINI